MMKAHGKYFIGRLSLVAMYFWSGGLFVWGHDLPQDRGLPPAASSHCFTSANLQPQAWADTATPWLDAAQYLWSAASNSASQVRASWGTLSSHWTDSSAQPAQAQELLIAAPEQGLAPRPRTHRLSPQPVALAQLLQHLDEAQCQISQLLFNPEPLQHAIAEKTQHGYRLLDQSLASLRLPHPSAPTIARQSAGPQFVVFETASGGHILLTVAQTQQWQFTVSAAEIAVAKSSVASIFNAALQPLQQRIFAAASEHLEIAGNALLHFSRSLADFAPKQVATLPVSNR